MNFKIQSMGHVVLITDQFNSKIGSTPILGTTAAQPDCRQAAAALRWLHGNRSTGGSPWPRRWGRPSLKPTVGASQSDFVPVTAGDPGSSAALVVQQSHTVELLRQTSYDEFHDIFRCLLCRVLRNSPFNKDQNNFTTTKSLECLYLFTFLIDSYWTTQ